MIEFEIGKAKYTIEKLKVKHYYTLQDCNFTQSFEDQVKFVSSLSECPQEELKSLKLNEFKALWAAVVDKFLTGRWKKPFYKIIEVNEKLYGFVHLDEISLGEFADMDVLQNDPQRDRKIHEMMAILYRPLDGATKDLKYYQVKPYDPKESKQRHEEFLELELDIVLGAINFFLALSKACFDSIALSGIKEAKTEEEKAMWKMVQLTTNELLGDGTTSYSSSPEKMSEITTKLADSLSSLALTTLHTSKTNEEEKKTKMVKNAN